MGVLSDIIIAGRDEAAAINETLGGHHRRWDTLISKGIDTVKIGTLSTIINGPSPGATEVACRLADNALFEVSEDGPWVFLVPPNLVSGLAALDGETERRVAGEWAATDEFRLSRWPPGDVGSYLHDLVDFARRAVAEKKDLLLWTSL